MYDSLHGFHPHPFVGEWPKIAFVWTHYKITKAKAQSIVE